MAREDRQDMEKAVRDVREAVSCDNPASDSHEISAL